MTEEKTTLHLSIPAGLKTMAKQKGLNISKLITAVLETELGIEPDLKSDKDKYIAKLQAKIGTLASELEKCRLEKERLERELAQTKEELERRRRKSVRIIKPWR